MADAPTKPAPSPTLTDTDLAKQINDHLFEMEVGDLLLQAKAKVGHGPFGKWIERKTDLSERSAQRYMALKEGWPKIEAWLKDNSATVADLSLRKAEQIIAPPPKEDQQQQQQGNGAPNATAPADPLIAELPATIKHHEEGLVVSLKTLRKSDEARAKDAASALVKRLVDADLYDAWSGAE